MRAWSSRVLVACAIAASLVASATNGCNDDTGDEPCGSLPDRTACPLARGGTCSDPDCAAVYSCRDGAWTLVQRCSPHPPADAGTADTGDGASCGDASAVDPGGPTCASLQLPDCDARIMDTCPAKACSTGCTGFLRCTNGEWSPLYVAYCDEDGVLVQNGKKPLDAATCGSPAWAGEPTSTELTGPWSDPWDP